MDHVGQVDDPAAADLPGAGAAAIDTTVPDALAVKRSTPLTDADGKHEKC